ncbi:MAG: tetratricopeptide repeat protein [Phycisphaerae bacterium]
MSTIRLTALTAIATALATPAWSASPEYVASRDVLLTFAATANTPVTGVELWVSCDNGQTWQKEPAERTDQQTVRYTAPADGRYALYLILRNAVGQSANPPTVGTRPHALLVLDTVAPTLQLHEILPPVAARPALVDLDPLVSEDLSQSPWAQQALSPATPAPITIPIRATVIDENLGPQGLRVFYRGIGEEEWHDGGTAPTSDGLIIWQQPDDLPDPFEVRVVATDLAGNQAHDELASVPDAPAPTSQPTETVIVSVAPASDAAMEPIAPVEPAAPVIVEDVEPLVLEDEAPASPPKPTNRPESEQLHRLGLRFMNERQYALAAARLEDALKLSPEDADLQVDLGSALYWSQRYSEADAYFEKALKSYPNHTGAIEGLALVAATEKRYPQAREHLHRLLKLMPESDVTWLRCGDIEHKLGNRDKAVEAWEHVLDLPNVDDSVREKALKRLRYFADDRPAQQP